MSARAFDGRAALENVIARLVWPADIDPAVVKAAIGTARRESRTGLARVRPESVWVPRLRQLVMSGIAAKALAVPEARRAGTSKRTTGGGNRLPSKKRKAKP